MEVFSVVLLIISSRICPWKRRFEQRSEEERDADQRRNDKTPNSRLMETVASLLLSLSRDGGRRTTRIAHKEMGVLVPKQRSWLRRRRRTSRLALSFSARVELVVPVSVEDWDDWCSRSRRPHRRTEGGTTAGSPSGRRRSGCPCRRWMFSGRHPRLWWCLRWWRRSDTNDISLNLGPSWSVLAFSSLRHNSNGRRRQLYRNTF